MGHTGMYYQLLDICVMVLTPCTQTAYWGAIQLFQPLGHMIDFTQNLKYSCCCSILVSIPHVSHHQDYLTISSHQLTKTCCSDMFTKLLILVLGMLIQGCMGDFLQEPLMLHWSATSLEYIIYYNAPHLPVLQYTIKGHLLGHPGYSAISVFRIQAANHLP